MLKIQIWIWTWNRFVFRFIADVSTCKKGLNYVCGIAHILKHILLGQKYFLSRIQQFTLAGEGVGFNLNPYSSHTPRIETLTLTLSPEVTPALPNRNCSLRT